MTCLCGQLNGRNHVTICRYDNREVTIVLIRIGNNLRCHPYICLFFLVSMDFIAALKAGNLFFLDTFQVST